MPNQTVKIVTDSASDLPAALVEQHKFGIVPLTVRFDDEEFVDQIELTTADFWKRCETSDILPSTAAPSPGSFAEAFRAAKAEGFDAVVCVTLSGGLSATYQNAVAGRELAKEDIDIRIVDSLSCTVAEAAICLGAAASAESGATADEVEAETRKIVASQKMLGSLDTLENLKKNGRIGAAGAFFAALLSVKPIITIEDGIVKPKGKQRTRSRALRTMAEMVIAEQPISRVGVCHSGAPDVDDFIEMLAPVAKREDILLTEMGATIGVHGGPRLIAVTFSTQPE